MPHHATFYSNSDAIAQSHGLHFSCVQELRTLTALRDAHNVE